MTEQIELMILDDLIIEITQGKYDANDRFPSENELADHYHVPRIKVRHALLKLEDMGYLYSKQGKGRFIKPKQRQIELHLSGSSSFSEKRNRLAMSWKLKILDVKQSPTIQKSYANLNVGQEMKFLRFLDYVSLMVCQLPFTFRMWRKVFFLVLAKKGPTFNPCSLIMRSKDIPTF